MSTSFIQSFTSSFSFVFITDLTDKSIFLIIILSQKLPTKILLTVALLSILSMNLLSIFVGKYITKIISEIFLKMIACILFITFGIISMVESFKEDNEVQVLLHNTRKALNEPEENNNYVLMNDDIETAYESNAELKFTSHLRTNSNISDISNFSYINSLNNNSNSLNNINSSINNSINNNDNIINIYSLNNNDNTNSKDNTSNSNDRDNSSKNSDDSDKEVSIGLIVSVVSMICLADIGDKSQITVITMAAIYNIYGVLIGSSLALSTTITLAALFGTWVCNKISPQILLFSGGIIFLVFAAEVLLNILYDVLSS
jgi:putative Ca2+/H+ antiporter (TMEM165/GDT1 family)